jgi:Lysine methyltransferase
MLCILYIAMLHALQVQEHQWGTALSGSIATAAADVVIASDVLFDPADWEALIQSLMALAAPRVVLAHRLRNKQEQQFFSSSRLVAHFTCEKVQYVHAQFKDVELYIFTRRAAE